MRVSLPRHFFNISQIRKLNFSTKINSGQNLIIPCQTLRLDSIPDASQVNEAQKANINLRDLLDDQFERNSNILDDYFEKTLEKEDLQSYYEQIIQQKSQEIKLESPEFVIVNNPLPYKKVVKHKRKNSAYKF